MVTGKGKHSTNISLKHFQLTDYFEAIETGSPEGPRKAEGIQAVVDLFKISKEETIYVGDAPSDIVASKKVGVPVIAAAWAETAEPDILKELSPNKFFTTVTDFREWLYARI
jgi:phosphoglycolate phosphatase/pyrophosphatase PpaX